MKELIRYAISDVHLYKGRQGSLKDLHKFLEKIPDKSLVLCGDIFDLLRSPLAEIEASFPGTIELLFQKAEYWVAGNHDREALSFIDGQYREVPVVEKLIMGNTLFLHLNQFDIVNGRAHVFGDTITRMVDWVADHTTQKVDTWARAFEGWARKVGRFGSKTEYRNLALDFVEWFHVGDKQISQVIGGHTHQPDLAERNGITYRNTGTWLNGRSDSLKLSIDMKWVLHKN